MIKYLLGKYEIDGQVERRSLKTTEKIIILYARNRENLQAVPLWFQWLMELSMN